MGSLPFHSYRERGTFFHGHKCIPRPNNKKFHDTHYDEILLLGSIYSQ